MWHCVAECPYIKGGVYGVFEGTIGASPKGSILCSPYTTPTSLVVVGISYSEGHYTSPKGVVEEVSRSFE